MLASAHEHWLFVCSANLIRSPTAEYVARKRGLLADSAGTHHPRGFSEGLVCMPLHVALIDWATIIVCMEQEHMKAVRRYSGAKHAVLKCWDIEDVYAKAYDPQLITLCERRLDQTLKELEEER